MIWAATILPVILGLRRAWVCDDAYITFRTVDNLVNGYGPVWNTDERVQTFTNPLWMLIISAFYTLTGEPYLTGIILSLVLTLLTAMVLALRVAPTREGALIGLLVLAFSNAFIDYTTSGLENPLTHLLLAAFVAVYLDRKHPLRVGLLSFIAASGGLNRLDTLLLYLPALTAAFLMDARERGMARAALTVVWGQIPLLAWLTFATFYYGSILPNTALAKLGTGIPPWALIRQGIAYLDNSLKNDPLTLTAVIAGMVLACVSSNRRPIWLAAGIGLYLLYLLRIGGDFAAGRFLTAPLLGAAALIAQFDWPRWPHYVRGGGVALTVLIGLLAPHPTFLTAYGDYNNPSWMVFIDRYGIADERMWYYPQTALWQEGHISTAPDHLWRYDGERLRRAGHAVVITDSIGMLGYYAGPHVHLVDRWALADPLLARLPAFRQVRWRIGHFDRVIPPGYLETLEQGDNQIADQRLALYYEKLRVITRGPLFDTARLREIWRLNTGQYDHLIDHDAYRLPYLVRVSLDDVAVPQTETVWRVRDATLFYDSGIEIALGTKAKVTQLEICLDANDTYQIVYLNGRQVVGEQRVNASSRQSVPATYTLRVPRRSSRYGYDRIRIFPLQGDDIYVLGHLILH